MFCLPIVFRIPLIVFRVNSGLENSPLVVSEQGARKMLYQKIVNSFPEGWMNSGQISREGQSNLFLSLSLSATAYSHASHHSEHHEEEIRSPTAGGCRGW